MKKHRLRFIVTLEDDVEDHSDCGSQEVATMEAEYYNDCHQRLTRLFALYSKNAKISIKVEVVQDTA
jgi:hypothetical protein